MANDLVTLFNSALSAVGHRDSIVETNEASREAALCNRWYTTIRDTVLRSAHWPSCRATAALTILAERTSTTWAEGDPDPPWLYLYNLPSDYLYPRFISTFEKFEITARNDAPKLLANSDEVLLVYTRKQAVTGAWDAHLWQAMIYGLAAHICVPLTGKRSSRNDLLSIANQSILEARAMAGNEDRTIYDHIPEWLVARGYGAPSTILQYIHPCGPLLTVGA